MWENRGCVFGRGNVRKSRENVGKWRERSSSHGFDGWDLGELKGRFRCRSYLCWIREGPRKRSPNFENSSPLFFFFFKFKNVLQVMVKFLLFFG